jgi:hypothetical protein
MFTKHVKIFAIGKCDSHSNSTGEILEWGTNTKQKKIPRISSRNASAVISKGGQDVKLL